MGFLSIFKNMLASSSSSSPKSKRGSVTSRRASYKGKEAVSPAAASLILHNKVCHLIEKDKQKLGQLNLLLLSDSVSTTLEKRKQTK